MSYKYEASHSPACRPNRQKAQAFYKAAQHDLTIMKRKIAITFDNEAIKSKFFTLLLGDINERAFLREEFPVGDFSLQEVAGMAVAHSIMQGGPSFSCLSPALYPLVLEEDCGIWPDYLPPARLQKLLLCTSHSHSSKGGF